MSFQNAPGGSRPASSLSRPPSSASHRTISRLSTHRPTSRISQRSSTKQSARVSQQIHDLISQITGLNPTDDVYAEALEVVSKRIDAISKQAVGIDLKTAQTHLKRLSIKARIQSKDTYAEAMSIASERIQYESQKRDDLDSEVKISKLPDHLQFLLYLARPPSETTLQYANRLVDLAHSPPPPSSKLTWDKILEEEPLTGEHWRGAYGLPAGAVREDWEDNESTEFSPILTPISDLADLDDTVSSADSEEIPEPRNNTDTSYPKIPSDYVDLNQRLSDSLRLREELDTLQRRQYWRRSWRTDAILTRPFSLDDPSTLCPTIAATSGKSNGVLLYDLRNERYINEHDAVREILMALQGRENLLFEAWNDSTSNTPKVKVSSSAPKLLHLSQTAQCSILEEFSRTATALAQLKAFCQVIIVVSPETEHGRTSQTLEAFAEAVAKQICRFDAWCSQREEMMLRAGERKCEATIVSLLSLSKALREESSDTFISLREVLFDLFPRSSIFKREEFKLSARRSLSLMACRLLDAVLDAAQAKRSFGDSSTATSLMEVFVDTAEPIWRMLGRWMRDGIFMNDDFSNTDHFNLPQEFFIKSNEIPLTDVDFWSDGYQLRSAPVKGENGKELEERIVVPTFLATVADKILGAGKSLGLLRILGKSYVLDASHGETVPIATWPSFESFLQMSNRDDLSDFSRSMSTHDISLVLAERLSPVCFRAGELLQLTLFADCELLDHIKVVEDVYLMRRGDLMSDFCDALFSRIDSRQIWADYHFLNTAFRDAIGANNARWGSVSSIRISYKAPGYSRFVRALKGLTVDYDAPYPLIYIFNTCTLRMYNDIFVFLLQIRRSKAALDNILIRNAANNSIRSYNDLKIFYGTRNKLSWFVNAISTFINQYVIQNGLRHFHRELETAKSLDDVLRVHNDHLNRMQKGCLLGEEEKNIHRAILAVLESSLTFSDFFTAFVGDTTFNISRASYNHSRRHRSRRLRRESRNLVSFSDVRRTSDVSDSSESDIDDSVIPDEPPADSVLPSFGTSSFYGGEADYVIQNDKLSRELDNLVRYIRREVEKAALSASRIEAYDILAFALQDWDL